ncbi:MAG: histidine kinase dimerization/phospho-acceptor domain-containing protein [Bryobacteraceae bacterium]
MELHRHYRGSIQRLRHDLRNSVQSIIGYSELLASSSTSLPDKEQRFVRNIQRGARNLLAAFDAAAGTVPPLDECREESS